MKRQKGIVILPIMVIILLLGVAGYFTIKNYQLKQQNIQIQQQIVQEELPLRIENTGDGPESPSPTTVEPIDESEEVEGEVCGGWDTSGEVRCKCSGKLTKPPCSSGVVCDGGTYYCEGQCTDCCYEGISVDHLLPKCSE